MCKDDVIYKTGSTQRIAIAKPLEEYGDTAMGSVHRKFDEVEPRDPRDVLADIHTIRQTHSSQYSAPTRGRSNNDRRRR